MKPEHILLLSGEEEETEQHAGKRIDKGKGKMIKDFFPGSMVFISHH
jgi:hypothetical protein